MSRRSRWMLALAVVYALAIAVVALWPSHVDKNLDTRDWPPLRWLFDRLGLTVPQGYDVVEFGANILWFAPFGILVRVLRSKWSWLSIVLAGAIVSAAIEILQAVARPGRTADVGDVVANTVGVALGCLVYAVARRRVSDSAGS